MVAGNRPCLARGCCETALPGSSRCGQHAKAKQAQRNATRPHHRDNAFTQAAAALRDAANANPYQTCALCGAGPLRDDPWTADHVNPGRLSSPLQVAHRSCNSSRGGKLGAARRKVAEQDPGGGPG